MKKPLLTSLLILIGFGVFPLTLMGTQPILIAQHNYFLKSPRLISAMTTYNVVRVWNATYYFTIQIPEGAGNTLAAVSFHQRRGTEKIRFNLDKTVAFEGTHRGQRSYLKIKSVKENPDTQEITVIFDSPIPSNTLFTVGLKPIRNPDYAGVYLFGVTVYPSGENPKSLYLGPGRLQFYHGGDGLF